MKITFYSVLLLTLLYSCGKSKKFECSITPISLPDEDTSIILIPSAFSPDGNGLNDQFRPYFMNANATSIDWSVYNDKGEVLFHTTELAAIWAPEQTHVGGVELCHYEYTAVTAQGNTVANCGDLYVCYCIPKGYDVSKLIFGDQFDPSKPKPYINPVSLEEFLPCK